jgi:uncharacterized protein
MKNKQLMEKIKNISKKEMSKNKRFHDYAHTLSVFNNAKEIIRGEKIENKVDSLVILTAALFHDLSNHDGLREGIDGARKSKKILEKLGGFPKDKIKDVERLIISHVKKYEEIVELDERILADADHVDALSKLSICRGFMLYAKRGLKLHDALLDFQAYINKKQKHFFTKTAKRMADKQTPFIKKFLDDCLVIYKK